MKKDNLEISISIKEINEISFKQSQVPESFGDIVFGKNLMFGLAFSFDIKLEDEIFCQKAKVKFLLKDIEDPIIELETEMIFHVKNLTRVVKKVDDGEIKIDDNFLATLTGVVIGTSRGILAKNTKGTVMSKYPLPILNPQDVLKGIEE